MSSLKSLITLSGLVWFTTAFGQLQNPKDIEYQWDRTDTSQRQVSLSEIQVVLPRNSFPTIDFPKFTGREAGLADFYPQEPVLAVEIDGKAKAYPLNMLTMHEISNDTLSGVPILPTYCPLCNSGIVYDRRLQHNGENHLLKFEVSGMLRNSDMVMADKKTESWWQQLTGNAIVGDFTGARLRVIPSVVISVEEFFERYPGGRILSTQTHTDAEKRYGENPYEGYDDPDSKPYSTFFDAAKIDHRLPPKQRVLDIRVSDSYKIYPLPAIAEKGVINDEFNGREVAIFHKNNTVSILDEKLIRQSKKIGSTTAFYRKLDGEVLEFYKSGSQIKDRQTGSVWDITGHCISGTHQGKSLDKVIHGNHFAFAWLAFHPDSTIYGE